ncbi:Gfo/Idh/MocA family protein [Shimia sp. Alg240-R146]|uniref:Gfo/Idh/MocA family protein n=1 Tax=Shimia sp. Alg240-R146 TaxID=2993449 RepID=UPI0022E6D9EF|nr:Gfo/Idh/MocA family oxidoreductase [Shimia sp. Alg240-R146]
MTRPIRLGMVGGGNDAFIGAVHRIAARIDGQFDLVAGALSSTPEKAQASGAALGLDPARTYDDFKAMAIREARLKDGIEAVAIVTPNHVHYPAAREFLKRGIHVICDKPLTSNLPDARKLAKAVDSSDALFILTHNYTGYPLMRQARQMVADGALGDIRVVQVEYPQDWLTKAQDGDNKQAAWRTDPARSGAGGSTGDIGTHAFNLACFVSGLTPEALSADLQSFVPGRQVDDNAHVMLRFQGGARGMLWCSQVAPGNENALKLRVYGSKGGIEWAQENPNQMLFTEFGKPTQILTRAGSGMGAAFENLTRTPGGHPEGYLEAFANLYAQTADVIRAHTPGASLPSDPPLPGISDGLAGVQFVDACVSSSRKNAGWVSLG